MDLSEFAKTGMYDKAGKPYRRYYCTKYGCYWDHKKKSPNGRMSKAKKIRQYKEQLHCVECNYSKESRGKKFSTWALQFHHHDHTKEANVGNMLRDGFGLRKIFQEIKNVLFCVRIVTWNYMDIKTTNAISNEKEN